MENNMFLALIINITPGTPCEGCSTPVPKDVTFLFRDLDGEYKELKIDNINKTRFFLGSIWYIDRNYEPFYCLPITIVPECKDDIESLRKEALKRSQDKTKGAWFQNQSSRAAKIVNNLFNTVDKRVHSNNQSCHGRAR